MDPRNNLPPNLPPFLMPPAAYQDFLRGFAPMMVRSGMRPELFMQYMRANMPQMFPHMLQMHPHLHMMQRLQMHRPFLPPPMMHPHQVRRPHSPRMAPQGPLINLPPFPMPERPPPLLLPQMPPQGHPVRRPALILKPEYRHDNDHPLVLFPNESGPNSYHIQESLHGALLYEAFQNYRENKQLIDMNVMVRGTAFPAHRVLLSVASNYFKEKITSICLPPKCGTLAQNFLCISIDMCSPKEFSYLMDYIYKGEVNVPESDIVGVMRAADELQIVGLCRLQPHIFAHHASKRKKKSKYNHLPHEGCEQSSSEETTTTNSTLSEEMKSRKRKAPKKRAKVDNEDGRSSDHAQSEYSVKDDHDQRPTPSSSRSSAMTSQEGSVSLPEFSDASDNTEKTAEPTNDLLLDDDDDNDDANEDTKEPARLTLVPTSSLVNHPQPGWEDRPTLPNGRLEGATVVTLEGTTQFPPFFTAEFMEKFCQAYIERQEDLKELIRRNRERSLEQTRREQPESPRSKSPTGEKSKSPREKSKSPSEHCKSPMDQSRSPREQPKSPMGPSKTPLEQTKSPMKQSKAPLEPAEPPREQSPSPSQQSRPHREQSESPIEQSKSPPEQSKSPSEPKAS